MSCGCPMRCDEMFYLRRASLLHGKAADSMWGIGEMGIKDARGLTMVIVLAEQCRGRNNILCL